MDVDTGITEFQAPMRSVPLNLGTKALLDCEVGVMALICEQGGSVSFLTVSKNLRWAVTEPYGLYIVFPPDMK